MVECIARRSALGHLADPVITHGVSGETLRVAVRGECSYLHLRVCADDMQALAACERALGAALPMRPNTITPCPGGILAWLGPGEWFVDVDLAHADRVTTSLNEASASQLIALADLSDGRCGFEIGGKHAVDVLRKGCAQDLHPRRFAPGQCARTALAKANVLLWSVRIDPDPLFQLVVDRSYADYLWRWVGDAALEFAQRRPPPSHPGMHHPTHPAPSSLQRRTP